MQPETRFKMRVQKRLSKITDCWHFKNVAGSVVGIPDIIGSIRGVFFAFELKIPPNKATKMQEYHIRLIKRSGGFAAVVTPRNLDQTLKELEKHVSQLTYEEHNCIDAGGLL
jgi:hypothetical protein